MSVADKYVRHDQRPRAIDVFVDKESKRWVRVLFDGRPCLLKGWTLEKKREMEISPHLSSEYILRASFTLDGVELPRDFCLTYHIDTLKYRP